MFDRMWANTSIPVVSQSLRFAELRHAYIANNIANVDTPGYRATDLPEGEFREALQQAIQARRTGGTGLLLPDSRNIRTADGTLDVKPVAAGGDARIDGNDVSLDLELTKAAKNVMEYQILARLLAGRLAFLRQAVRERVG